MHASIQATLYNAHFDTGGTPWTADDLMGKGDRQKRVNDRLASKIATSRMMSDSKGRPTPEWALEIERTQKVLVK